MWKYYAWHNESAVRGFHDVGQIPKIIPFPNKQTEQQVYNYWVGPELDYVFDIFAKNVF